MDIHLILIKVFYRWYQWVYPYLTWSLLAWVETKIYEYRKWMGNTYCPFHEHQLITYQNKIYKLHNAFLADEVLVRKYNYNPVQFRLILELVSGVPEKYLFKKYPEYMMSLLWEPERNYPYLMRTL